MNSRVEKPQTPVNKKIWWRGFPGGAVKKNPLVKQETGVQSLIGEDPTCFGATKHMSHHYWDCSRACSRACRPQLLKPLCPRACAPQENPPQWEAHPPQLDSSPHSLQVEKSLRSNEDPAQSKINKIQFSSATQSCLTLGNPMDCSMPGFPVHHQLPEFTQTHVHWVGDAIQTSHPLLSPSPPAFNLSQHQGFSQRVSSLHQVAKVLEPQLQHQSFQWTPRTDR